METAQRDRRGVLPAVAFLASASVLCYNSAGICRWWGGGSVGRALSVLLTGHLACIMVGETDVVANCF